MDIAGILKKSFESLKKNPLLAVPSLVAVVVTTVLTVLLIGGTIAAGGLGGGFRGEDVAAVAVGAGVGVFVVTVIGGILSLLAHAMTLSMAREVLDTGTTTLAGGGQMLLNRIVDFLVAGVITGIAVGIGSLILFLPGIAAMFFLMLAYPAIVVEGKSGIEALIRSVVMVKDRIGESLMLFGVLIGITVAVFVANAIVGVVPVIGQIAGLVLWAAMGAFVSLVLVQGFRHIASPPAPASPAYSTPEPPPPPLPPQQ